MHQLVHQKPTTLSLDKAFFIPQQQTRQTNIVTPCFKLNNKKRKIRTSCQKQQLSLNTRQKKEANMKLGRFNHQQNERKRRKSTFKTTHMQQSECFCLPLRCLLKTQKGNKNLNPKNTCFNSFH
jgi:hypothetical protein